MKSQQNKTPSESSSDSGDLGESRTRIDGMKTRCTNRYTTRPYNFFIITKNFKNCKSSDNLHGNRFCRMVN